MKASYLQPRLSENDETKAARILIGRTQGVHTDVNRMNNRGVDVGVVHAFSQQSACRTDYARYDLIDASIVLLTDWHYYFALWLPNIAYDCMCMMMAWNIL